MPTYEYECAACGHRFEAFQRISDRPLRACPECRGKVRRLIGTGAGVLFKGSGFYATDYRSESYRKAASRETPEKRAADPPAAAPAGSDSAKSAGGRRKAEARKD